MAEEIIDILIRLAEQQQFTAETQEAGAAVRKIGTEAKAGAVEAEEGARRLSGVVGMIGRAARGTVVAMAEMSHRAPVAFASVHRAATAAYSKIEAVSKRPILGGGIGSTLLGFGAGYLSVSGIKQSVDKTTELAKMAFSLHKVSGMSVQDAATWAAVVQAYGVNATRFAMSMRAISTQTLQAQQGSQSALAIFNALGISLQDIQKRGGDMNSMLSLVIDRFDKLPPGVDKTAIATHLFGRSWQTLMPLFSQGSAAINRQREEAKAYGITLGGNAMEGAMKLHEAQVQLRIATLGLQVQFAEHMAPAILKVFAVALQLFGVLRTELTPAFKVAGGVVHSVTQFFKEHRDLLRIVKVVLAALVAMWVIGRIQIIAARIAMMVLNGVMVIGKALMIAWKVVIIAWRAAMLLGTAAVWLFNAALDANPIGIIILAIGALIAIIVLLITHWHQVEHAVVSVWNTIRHVVSTVFNAIINFIKAHWKLLPAIFLGPLGIVITLFLKFHGAILKIFGEIWAFIKRIPSDILHIFLSAGGAILNAIVWPFKKAFEWIKNHLPHFSVHHIGPIPIPLPSFGTGGVMPFTGPALVGERGPEIVQLPGGSRITPIGTAGFAGVGAMSFEFQLEIPVYIGGRNAGREIARATGKYVSDRRTRQGQS